MPDANHDEDHEDDCAVVAEDVDEDLHHGLSDVAVHRGVEILDGEEKRDEEKEAKDCGDAERHQNPKRCAPRCVEGFLGEMGGRVEAEAGLETSTIRSGSRSYPVIVYWLIKTPQTAT